jgi:hypothetical protein
MADIEYVRSRALAERPAAALAVRVAVRLRHLEFAEVYEFRIRELNADLLRSAALLTSAH